MAAEIKYESLLKAPQWQEKRNKILSRDRNQCLNCSAGNNLEIHHKQYHFDQKKGQMVLPWEYEDKYLITLCSKCHETGHQLYKVPVYTI